MERDTNPVINMNYKIISEKIELSIKLMNNVSIPSIILEYKINDNLNFNAEDLKQLYSHFGKVLFISPIGKQNIVLFQSFFSAYICKIFLENKDNYKNNLYNNFSVRWFDLNRDIYLLPNKLKEIFANISNRNLMKMNINSNNVINRGVKMDNNLNSNINLNMNNNTINDGNNNIFNSIISNNMNNPIINYDRNVIEYNNINNIIGIQPTPNIINNNVFLNRNNLSNNINLNALNNINNNLEIMNTYNNYNNINVINNMSNINNINNFNININDNYNYRMFNRNNAFNNINTNEEKVSGKYTCKYEILIENDSEFQIARRVIGSKGINMKNIINECKIEGEKESVKLRLRGKGSGYKEGPQNKESDEPLHLCISSKTKEEMNKACFLVNKLLDKINEEYKIYCEKNGKIQKKEKIARKMENQNINFKFNN